MYQKDFHGQTNSAAEDSLSQLNYQRQVQATNLIEFSLSKILARLFVECWNQLKTKPHTSIKIGRSRLATERYDGRKKHFGGQRCKTVQGTFSARPQINKKNNINKYLQTEVSCDTQEQVDRNRYQSVRVVKHHVQESRAKVLQEIVMKLKRNKIEQTSPSSKNSKQILQKINKLQKLMNLIKNQNNTNHTKIQSHHFINHYNPKHQSNLVQGITQEIHQIRKQVSQIKLNNQSILKLELERSQNQSKSKSRIVTENTKNQYGTIGVQTNIVERPLSYAEIQQKHKRLSQEAFYQSKVTPNTNFQSSLASNLGQNSKFQKSYVSLSPLTIAVPPVTQLPQSTNNNHFQTISKPLIPPQSYSSLNNQSNYTFTHHLNPQPLPQNVYQTVSYPTIQSNHQPAKQILHNNHQSNNYQTRFIVNQPISSVVVQPQQQVIHHQSGLNVSFRENSVSSNNFCSACRRNCQCKPIPLQNLRRI